ncbi:C40 family peptidase [Spiractinospora alimapuensis]|uniref:C40 family peptidase n=1 Tax=Spiractinospora alimapuensis TaxID=2820884 RepID=UPI001F1C6413|nr:C40 family peptidase [Spiractinospora alimapuensis]
MASILEHGIAIGIGAAIVTTVAATDIPDQIHDGVREAVCLVEGPECGGETWTEHDRPDEPEEPPAFGIGGGVEIGDVDHEDLLTVIEWAVAQQGKPYLWGGNGPDAFDCSGLIQQAYLQVGVNIPRTTTTMWPALPEVSQSELTPGDLIFLNMGSSRPQPDHMGMFIGNNQMMHCGNPCQVVTLDSYWQQRYMGARRVIT